MADFKSILKNKNPLIEWCIAQHKKTNHQYDAYLPYEFHLRMVVKVAEDFLHLIPNDMLSDVLLAAWGHDLIEDTRVSYNDVKNNLGEVAADIIYALTNEKGKTRKERANEKYYNGIVETDGAVFVKLCDRIANVQYSKMSKSKMFEVYKQENESFIISLGYQSEIKDSHDSSNYNEMFHYLLSLFND
jgi:(p)ppGpp synthase/HD superfamily hydrolase